LRPGVSFLEPLAEKEEEDEEDEEDAEAALDLRVGNVREGLMLAVGAMIRNVITPAFATLF